MRKIIFIFVFLLFLLFLFSFGFYFYSISLDYKLENVSFQTENYVKIENIPVDIQKTIVAVEDNRFHYHNGIDPRGILRAIIRGIEAGKPTEGASTITQQVAKNVFLTHERTIERKIKEISIALNLENNYEKKIILETYLNYIYFGEGTYGIVDASSYYFGKELNELSLDEVALLCGLPQAPTSYSPEDNYDLAITRRNTVLSVMLDHKIISQDEFNSLIKKPIILKNK